MTLKEFEDRIEGGEELVIIDDLVLNVGKFKSEHPGGKFLLEHNVGRDISKFFYGGYYMDGNLIKGGSQSNTHSNVARKIVDLLSIARITVTSSEPVSNFQAQISSRTPLTPSVTSNA